MENLIFDLTPQDFELLVELVFSNTGWIRVGAAGGQERDIDLELISPVTNERVAVQIKSKANQSMFEDCVSRFDGWEVDQFFFIYHSANKAISSAGYDERYIKILDSKKLAKLVISAGLAHWLIEKAS